MKILISTLLVFVLPFWNFPCLSSDSNLDKEKITAIKNGIDVKETLNKGLIELQRYPSKDSVFYPLGYNEMEEDSIPLIAVGRFIDGKQIYAVHISGTDEATLTFYCFLENQWQIIGEHKASMDVFKLDFKDFDGDGRNEIVTSGHQNMNGNYSNDFYYCSPKTNTIHFSGTFFCRYDDSQIDKVNKTLKIEYEGSWYANSERTVYKWVDEYLIAQKQLVIGLKNADGKHNAQFMEYYENPTPEIENLVLKFRKNYSENNKKLNNLWEHFFD